jgi:hypothetical protein
VPVGIGNVCTAAAVWLLADDPELAFNQGNSRREVRATWPLRDRQKLKTPNSSLTGLVLGKGSYVEA